MSAKARARHEKGLEMAAAVAERTQNKIEKSKGRGRNVQQRAKNWEEINKAAEEAENAQESGDEEVKQNDRGFEMDEEMNGADESTLTAPAEDNAPAAAPQADEDGDEIL